MLFGQNIWDPWLIIAQIGIMQSSFYLLTGFWLVFLQTLVPTASTPTLSHLLSASMMDRDVAVSIAPVLALFFSAPLCAVICAHVVDRAWQCLDFSGTVYFLHLIACTIHSGFPLYWEWWLANGLSMTIMVLLSEYWLVKKEQQPIEMDKMLSAMTHKV
uniref:Protein SYS1 homolog n=1 Tax=Lotharella globosa TaxID=91324 RepID=A0A6U3BLW5_9EUKA|mmetsp:Transcript_21884/g.43956  ORF Transcript_21884/g.43956 Transcript_21884/m.43956 type:complete len:159 (+) Transcript_21884:89-565(+)